MTKFILLFLFLPLIAFGQKSKKDSLWLPFKYFVGAWKGQGGGDPGKGLYERSYRHVLNNNFIEVKNRSSYAPTKKNPGGEVHEDIGFFSHDKLAGKFKLRQFYAEGFVNEYVLDSISADQKTIVFISVGIENIPKGFRAKETYTIISEKEFEEIFEIAEPGKDFEIYSRVRLFKN